jgi:2-polyprenyl-3-methyl-5-hydroxy-6-metoxy-1,4-benzoquinol methylase
LECENCGLVFLSSFEHFNEKIHENSGMFKEGGLTTVDTIFKFNKIDNNRRYKQFEELIFDKDILDFGCGVGNFLIQAKERAKSCCGVEVNKEFMEFHRKLGLEVVQNLNEINKKFDVIFMFLVLPFIQYPLELLKILKTRLKNGGQVVIETPNIDDALLTLYGSEAFSNFIYTTMSLFYYNKRTLSDLLAKAGYKVNYVKNYQRYNLSNHLYWLSKQQPKGHQIWDFLDSWELNNAYAASLAKLGKCDTLIGSFGI